MWLKIRTNYENSSLYRKRLIKKYKKSFSPGERSFKKILVILEKGIDLLEITSDQISRIFWKYGVMENIGVKNQKLDFKVYSVQRNIKSRDLYNVFDEVSGKNDIVIIYEKNTGFLTSNFSKVELLLLILKGVSENDYKNNTPVLFNYLIEFKEFVHTSYLNKKYLVYLQTQADIIQQNKPHI